MTKYTSVTIWVIKLFYNQPNSCMTNLKVEQWMKQRFSSAEILNCSCKNLSKPGRTDHSKEWKMDISNYFENFKKDRKEINQSQNIKK